MKKSILIAVLFILCSFQIFSQRQPYVILVSFDGFRWDYAGRGLSPNLDSMKADGVSAISLRPSFPSITFPNHYTIITGMYPENHGIIANSFYDQYSKELYRMGDTNRVKDAKWYWGEAFWETARRNGIITASYFWPGSEMKLDYRRPDYSEAFDGKRPYDERVNGVINWLKLSYNERPHFITLYFEATDHAGHLYGPNSPQVNDAIAKEDSMIGLLNSKLKEIGLKDSTDIIVVSDHGMTEISKSRVVNVEEIVKDYKVYFRATGPLMMIQPENPADKMKIYEALLNNQKHYEVFTKDNIPACYHFSTNPFISDIILIPDLGWSLVDNRAQKNMDKYQENGNHGYDNNQMDMNGIFFASGPDFKSGYRVATLNNIDIYPLLCKLFNITPRSNIDGRLENIEYILKGF